MIKIGLLYQTKFTIFFCFVLMASACAVIAQDIKISISESKINDLIAQSNQVTSGQKIPFRIQNIDMRNGFIQVNVNYQKEDGEFLNGQYDFVIDLSSGQPKARITRVDLSGLELDNQTLDQIADLIMRDFLFASSQIQGNINLKSVNFFDDRIDLTLKFQP